MTGVLPADSKKDMISETTASFRENLLPPPDVFAFLNARGGRVKIRA